MLERGCGVVLRTSPSGGGPNRAIAAATACVVKGTRVVVCSNSWGPHYPQYAVTESEALSHLAVGATYIAHIVFDVDVILQWDANGKAMGLPRTNVTWQGSVPFTPQLDLGIRVHCPMARGVQCHTWVDQGDNAHFLQSGGPNHAYKEHPQLLPSSHWILCLQHRASVAPLITASVVGPRPRVYAR